MDGISFNDIAVFFEGLFFFFEVYTQYNVST